MDLTQSETFLVLALTQSSPSFRSLVLKELLLQGSQVDTMPPELFFPKTPGCSLLPQALSLLCNVCEPTGQVLEGESDCVGSKCLLPPLPILKYLQAEQGSRQDMDEI